MGRDRLSCKYYSLPVNNTAYLYTQPLLYKHSHKIHINLHSHGYQYTYTDQYTPHLI